MQLTGFENINNYCRKEELRSCIGPRNNICNGRVNLSSMPRNRRRVDFKARHMTAGSETSTWRRHLLHTRLRRLPQHRHSLVSANIGVLLRHSRSCQKAALALGISPRNNQYHILCTGTALLHDVSASLGCRCII